VVGPTRFRLAGCSTASAAARRVGGRGTGTGGRDPSSSTEKDYQQAAEWAEHDMPLRPTSTTALRGEGAAAFGRDLLERATGGRPSIDPKARPGEHSPVRQVRLPGEVNEQLAALAHAGHRRPSDVIRAAVTDYIADHTAS